ncbi:MAG: hypothetical protein AAFX06_00145 [Planctomycetota bacterium]
MTTMSPDGFAGVTNDTPYGRDTDGAPLLAAPTYQQIVGSTNNLKIRDLILNILQNNNEKNLTPEQARALVDYFTEN